MPYLVGVVGMVYLFLNDWETILRNGYDFYTAVSVWENDCSGIVIRVLEVQWAEVGIGSSDCTGCTAKVDPAATENRLPLSEACFCKTLWMFGLLVACCNCWLSIPCRKAFTTRIWKKSVNQFHRGVYNYGKYLYTVRTDKSEPVNYVISFLMISKWHSFCSWISLRKLNGFLVLRV